MDFYSDVMRLFEVVFEVESSVVGMFGVWFMENFSKVVIVVFVFFSVLVFIVMFNYGEQSVFICVEVVVEELQRILYFDLNLNYIIL